MFSCFRELKETYSCFSNQINVSKKQPSIIIEELCDRFSLAELQLATNNFHPNSVISQDSFGIIYKGHLEKRGIAVAIKRWCTYSFHGLSEFKNEIVLLSQLQHPNLMSLIGFCIERDELILVHEYMVNGSLHDHIHYMTSPTRVDPLAWKRRLQICTGVARALHYLHTGAKYAIIHRDLHIKNIFLDENWEPKVAGLMLSKRGPLSNSRSLIRVESAVRGTSRYIDLQYATTGVLTEKSDVFSFGVLLLEVVSPEELSYLFEEHVINHNHSLESNAEKIVDPFLRSKIAPECWKTLIGITQRCLLDDGTERPSMGEVEVELEHALKLQEEADARNTGGDHVEKSEKSAAQLPYCAM